MVSFGLVQRVRVASREREKMKERLRRTYPGALSQAVEAELVGDLGGVHGVLWRVACQLWCNRKVVERGGRRGIRRKAQRRHRSCTYRKILLVGKDEQDGIPQLILVEHALELLTGLDDTVAIVAVDDEDDALGVLEVMPPEGADLVLATDVPHGELDVLVLDGLDVEA